MKTLGEMGEHKVIQRLTAQLKGHADLRVGAGDDCAVSRLPGSDFDQVFTTDPVVEGIHFNAGEKPQRVGHKAVGRALSDVAAMGGRPQWILVNVVAPPELECAYLEQIYEGMTALSSRFGATIIGGDLAQGPGLELHVFATGLLPAGSALLRSGARIGDLVFVSGPLGCSIQGKHLDFIPRVEEGLFLRESGAVTAMMDISDGLATDLRHLLKQSGVGAILDEKSIPTHGTIQEALYDGEDFELLFTVPADSADALLAGWNRHFVSGPYCVGHITESAEHLELKKENGSVEILTHKAFEHFFASPRR